MGDDTINSRDGTFDFANCGNRQSAANPADDFDTVTAEAGAETTTAVDASTGR
jgi:hypothetical protein